MVQSASRELVRQSGSDEPVWAGDRAHGVGMLGTDGHDDGTVLADGFHAHPAIEGPIREPQAAPDGAADGTGTSAESQRFTMGT